MIGIYLSGTGNTRHCVEKLTGLLDSSAESMPLESRGTVEAIRNNDTIILGYPTQFSNAPYMVRDFIHRNAGLWKGKSCYVFQQWVRSAVTALAVPQDYSKNMVQLFWADFISVCRTQYATVSF